MTQSSRSHVVLLVMIAIGCAKSPERQAASRADSAAAVVDSAMIVSAADRDAESARLRALGLRVPDGGVVLERPWLQPFTRRSFVVPQAWFADQPSGNGAPPTVSTDALVKDLPLLEEVMRRAYGGWETAERRGWSWEKWFADWRALLRSRPLARMKIVEAFAPMKQLMEFQLDNHTTIPLGAYFGSGAQTAAVQGSPTAPCTELKSADGKTTPLDPNDPAQRVRHAQRWNPATHALEPVAYLSFPLNRGAPASIRCGTDRPALSSAWPADDPVELPDDGLERRKVVLSLSGMTADEPDLKRLEPTIAYLRLPSFTKKNTQLIERRYAGWPKPNGQERVLIVDLRDNEGGDATPYALREWIDVARFERVRNTHRHEGASCLYSALRWGYVLVSSSGVKPPLTPFLTRQLQGSLDDLFQPSTRDCPRAFKDTDGGWDLRQRQMQPPGLVEGRRRIVVLVNNGTGSDGEFMALLLASLPESVVVGSNTYGVGQYIQPGFSVLPRTRLPFRIALGTNDPYGDRRSLDGYGLDVDVLLWGKEDQARENILALARFIGGR